MRAMTALVIASAAAIVFVPARRLGGSLPAPPGPTAIGWVEETVELEVDASGRVSHATLLRAASPRSSLLVPAVADWRFRPATDRRGPTASRVRWTFTPARRDGEPVPAYAYLAFGFRQPQ